MRTQRRHRLYMASARGKEVLRMADKSILKQYASMIKRQKMKSVEYGI